MLTSNTLLQTCCALVRRIRSGAAITLLSAGFVLAIASSSDSSASNSNELIAMSASPTRQESTSPQVTRTDVDPTVLGPDAVVIVITEDSQFYINKKPVERNDIPQRVSALLRDTPPERQIVYLKAAATVRYDTIASIIDSMRELGVEQIGLVAEKRGAKSPALQQRRVTQAGKRVIRAIQAVDNLVVSVRAGTTARNQRVKVSSISLPLAELGATLREILATRTDKTVFISAPGQTLHKDIMRIIDVVKNAGAKPVGLSLSKAKTNTKRNANTRRRASYNNKRAGGQIITLNDQGISLVLPTGLKCNCHLLTSGDIT